MNGSLLHENDNITDVWAEHFDTEPARLAALADRRLRATPEQLCDALGACAALNPSPVLPEHVLDATQTA